MTIKTLAAVRKVGRRGGPERWVAKVGEPPPA